MAIPTSYTWTGDLNKYLKLDFHHFSLNTTIAMDDRKLPAFASPINKYSVPRPIGGSLFLSPLLMSVYTASQTPRICQ